jgi:hypothetical protein
MHGMPHIKTTFLVYATQHSTPTRHHFNQRSALKTTGQLKAKENNFKEHYTHYILMKARTVCSSHIYIALCSHPTLVTYHSLDKINLSAYGQIWE